MIARATSLKVALTPVPTLKIPDTRRCSNSQRLTLTTSST
jgi:hypothetical protein